MMSERQQEGAPRVPGATPAPPPKDKKWYIVHTYSGQEQRAKQALLERVRSFQREEYFDEVLIPEESVVEVVKGQKRTSKRKFFPGYILVRMDLNSETWHIVKGTGTLDTRHVTAKGMAAGRRRRVNLSS